MSGSGLIYRPRIDSVQEQASTTHSRKASSSQEHHSQIPRLHQPHSHDWTADLVQTDHVRFFRETDWASTPLGPLESWSLTLQHYTRMVMADSRAACLWWGPQLIAIYNEKYKRIAGRAHPQLMGGTFMDGLPDRWPQRKGYFEHARKTGLGIDYNREHPLFVQHDRWREETFYTGNVVPVGDGPADQPEGFYNSLVEDTSFRLSQRRTSLLNRMASVVDATLTDTWPLILATLETDGPDIPMALLYKTEEVASTTHLRLRGQIGIPDGHNLLVDGAPLTSERGVIPECRRAGHDVLVIEADERFRSIMWRGYGEAAHHIGILPLASDSGVLGYLVVGTNPCRAFGDDCNQFLHDLRRVISQSISIAVTRSEAARRQRQLEVDLNDSDTKLRHLIEHGSVGMCNVGLDGKFLWANEQYCALHGLELDTFKDIGPFAFFDLYTDEDKAKCEAAWDEIVSGRTKKINMELELRRSYTCPSGEKGHPHIQISVFPYHEHGVIKSIMGAFTDISRLKWAQNFQARLAAEAREAKRQQEAFIDVVSHEMRNPLSAIVHCADEISKSAQEYKATQKDMPQPDTKVAKLLEDNVSSANIILQCSEHQKRIIDDVLTLSRLDSMLLSFNPNPTRPVKLINTIVSIFEAELKTKQITYNVIPDPSLSELNIRHVYLDPSRVTQIFINLITNAIKFTKSSEHPSISITYGASLSNPRDFFPADMYWATRKDTVVDMTDNPEWGDGEALYLTFIVQDTGIGMTNWEIRKVFDRFQQANMRTHVKYGGSGLGLFISKQLTEKQGGEIGVVSEPGKGSTFGFYIKTRRVENRLKSLGILPSIPQHVIDSATSTNPRGTPGSDSEKAQLRVLLVEDNLINQQVLVRQLRKAGCVVDIANHGSEALEILDMGKTFDVVLMDLEMPVMDGLTAMQEIREREEDGRLPPGHLPMIAVTANVRDEQIEEAKSAGADHVMQKPFKAIDLVRMMKTLVPQVGTPGSEPTTPGLIGPLSGMLL
ncbi:uncharacterized protein EI97DRAFT_386612 [Westerdykella ornata]|uniref:histidine kinase n=1 Tax=Westerdykella ornata TaxID=318751 RepID=A0A6A6J8V7_WESOR|nr:uncharacterized protein EI97DRAFT_386612 [Westerdykella ornata]KAF2272076.1 hypothetical protein EI97DRAFT_386612 [Westerdykella ornata]